MIFRQWSCPAALKMAEALKGHLQALTELLGYTQGTRSGRLMDCEGKGLAGWL